MRVGDKVVRDLFFAVPGHRGKARPVEGQDVQGEPQQSELQEIPACPQPKLHAIGSQYNNEAHQYPRDPPVPLL
jgi:hypothetical protein